MSNYSTHGTAQPELSETPELEPVNGLPASSAHAPESETALGGATVFAVGEYLVGDAEDTLLNGHPDIRY